MSREYRFGLLGHNIAYSKSPSIFAMLAEIRNADIRFDVFDITPESLASNIDKLKRLDGFSVTIPFKLSLLPYLESLSDEARLIGAVNSVKVENKQMRGYNTDAIGFIVPLRKAGFDGGKILVLGAGGAARAVIYALNAEYPEAKFSVCGRNEERVAGFVADIAGRYQIAKRIRGRVFDEIDQTEQYDVIVNCTPAGGAAHPEECPVPDNFGFTGKPICYDLVYEPAQTIFLERAARCGCRAIGGLSMLVRQAVESYTIWTGDDLDRDAVSREISARLYRGPEGDNS
jgi:shikimate dehydrogenase